VTDLRVARNKLGGSQGAIVWKLTTDPYAINDRTNDQVLETPALTALITANTQSGEMAIPAHEWDNRAVS
jgi:hypothetical protein